MSEAYVPPMKRCTRCKLLKPLADFTASKSGGRYGRMSRCKRCCAEVMKRRRDAGLCKPQRVDPEKSRARAKREAADLARRVYAHYGRECACCGSAERLEVDHMDGRGREHRIELFGRSSVPAAQMYRWLIRNGFPDGFQVLCQPCNSSKARGSHCRLWHGDPGFDRCSRCEQVWPLTEFGRDSKRLSGRNVWCAACRSECGLRRVRR